MSDKPTARVRLLEILKAKSVFFGDFTLASGAKSTYYIDCRLTTLDAEGATLIGEVLAPKILSKAGELGVDVSAVGGLTMGADPIALATAMASHRDADLKTLQAFVVRKEAKDHGKGKQIEGNFSEGDCVVAIDDVITTGGSTLKAVDAIEAAGGKVAFVAVLVERGNAGRSAIEGRGYPVISVFAQEDLLGDHPAA